MVSEWSTVSSDSKYYNDQTEGWMEKTGWIWAIPSDEINSYDNEDDEYRWFYAPSSGKVVKEDLKSINGKKYIFDKTGIMRDGLVILDKTDKILALIDEEDTEGADLMKGTYTIDEIDGLAYARVEGALDEGGKGAGNALYYFSADGETDGSMKTGKNIKIELEDDEYTFGFKSNGEAYHGEEDNKIYLNGVLAKASTDYRYQAINNVMTLGDNTSMPDTIVGDYVFPASAELDDANYVVGTSGTVVKAGKYVKDSDDGYYAVSDNGQIKEYAKNVNDEAGRDEDGKSSVKGIVAYFEDDEFARDKAKDFADCGAYGDTVTDDDGDEKYESVCK